jgi:hypothetical protein
MTYLLCLCLILTLTDAKQLIKEIASSIRKLSKDGFVAISFVHCYSEYEKSFLPLFNMYMNVSNGIDDNRILQINMHNRDFKRKELSSRVALGKAELALVPRR